MSSAVSSLATIGSLVVAVDPDTKKVSLNIGPTVVLVYAIASVGCSFNHDEPFAQCVKSVVSIFGAS